MSRDENLHDDRLSALYRAHVTDAQPSAASDAKVLRLAREAVASPAVAAVASTTPEVARIDSAKRPSSARADASSRGGWRAWLTAPWFGPGLAFATVASLSVVVIALMPKDEMAIEREVASAPAGAAKTVDSAPAAAGNASTAASSVSQAPEAASGPTGDSAATLAANDAARASASSASSSVSASSMAVPSPSPSRETRARVATDNTSRAKVAADLAEPTVRDARVAAPVAQPPAAPAPAYAPAPASAPVPAPAAALPSAPAPAPAPAFAPFVPSVSQAPAPAPSASRAASRADTAATRQEPNPFPAQPSGPSAGAARMAAPAASAPSAPAAASPPPPPAAFADATRPEKQSLQTETAESRIPGPIAEVPDSAPTYANEAKPSIPLPYTYQMPKKSRDAGSGVPGAAGQVAKPSAPPSVALRKEESARTLEKSGAAPSLAAAQAHRDPAEWVKAIQKLRSEGKNEQVLKELVEFRKQYPQYVLPDELRNLK